MKKIIGLFVVLAVAVCCVQAEMRTWTSIKGDTIEAEFVKLIGLNVVLKKEDGKQLKVPKRGLCKADHEYLASMIPPKIKFKIDVKKERKTLSSRSEDRGDVLGTMIFEEKRERASCHVVITKTNREPCNRKFKAYVYVFAEEIGGKDKKVMAIESRGFNFSKGNQTSLMGAGNVDYQENSYSGKTGYRYSGYLVLVEDDKGEIIAVEASKNEYESNIGKIRQTEKGKIYDDEFNKLPDSVK